MKPALLLYPHISSYPVLLLLGFFFGWLLARSRANFFGIEKRHLDNIALILPIAGLFGARFFARLFYAKLGFWEALKVWEGDGLVFYGGFIFGAASVLAYGITRRVRLLPLLDCLAPSIALGLAFGRIGCFMAGCCWGDACLSSNQAANISELQVRQRIQTLPSISTASMPLAVQFPARSAPFKQHLQYGLVPLGATFSAPVHPVQLYESALALALCGLLHFARRRRPGGITIAFLLGYAFIRFCTEFLRADNQLAYWGLTFSQTVSLGIAALALICLWVRARAPKSLVPAAPTPCKPHPAIG